MIIDLRRKLPPKKKTNQRKSKSYSEAGYERNLFQALISIMCHTNMNHTMIKFVLISSVKAVKIKYQFIYFKCVIFIAKNSGCMIRLTLGEVICP